MTYLPAGLRLLLRRLRRSPGFTALTVVTVALGIGANTAVFSVVDGILLEPLPYPEADRLVSFQHTAPGLGLEEVFQSPTTYFTYRDEMESLEEIGLWLNSQATITGVGEPERVATMRVTDGTLRLLGVEPFLGRSFTLADDQGEAPLTVILSYRYWSTRLGADPGVLGTILRVNGRPREIIGVMPEGYRFLDWDPLLYQPFQFDRSSLIVSDFSYRGIARLQAGVTIDRAVADAARVFPMTFEKFSGGLQPSMVDDAGFAPEVVPLKEKVVGAVQTTLWVILVTVGLVLFIACANVANLFLVRADGRAQELAVRKALGGTRGVVARGFLAESVILGLMGGLVGTAIAWGGVRILRAIGPVGLPRLEEVGIDGSVLLFTLLLSVGAGILFGVIPLIRRERTDLMAALREGGRGGDTGKARGRARSALVVVQVALALVLLVGAGLMIRTIGQLRQVDPGFASPESALTARVMIPWSEVRENAEAALLFEQILQRIEDVPGVERAGFARSITMDGWTSADGLWLEDSPTPEGELPPIRGYNWASPGYFSAMGNPLKAGRDFTWDDIRSRRPVAVITEDLAREHWGNAPGAIGRRIKEWEDNGGIWREIVGVVGDVYDAGVDQAAVPTVYWPHVVANFWEEDIFLQRSMAYVIRSPRAGTSTLVDDVRAAVWSVDPNLPLANVQTLQTLLDNSMGRAAFTLVILAAAALLALLLGVVGIYGVTSYVVALRRREIGVRVALGASRGEIAGFILRRGLRLSGAGVAIGLIASAGLTQVMQSLLYGVSPLDPLTFASVIGILVTVSTAANLLPALRAARTDPSVVLREE